MRRRAPILSFLVLCVLAALQLGGSCVDGVTPDCSDAAECGPVVLDASEAATGEGGASLPPPANDAAPPSDASEAGDAPDGG